MLPLQFLHLGPPFPTLLRPADHPQNSFKFWAVGQSVGRLVGRSRGSHTNITLPLQFCHPGPPFPTLLCPAGHPENSLQFWLVGWSIGHREVTRTSLCLFSFVTLPRPSRPFYALWATPKTALNFGWLVGWLIGRSVTGKSNKRHAASSVSAPRPALSNPFTPCGPPQNGLKFWLVGWSVGWSQGSHTNVTLPIQFHHKGPPFRTLLRPARHPQKDLKFWSSGQSVGQLRGSHTKDTLPL
jgi:hypothetical protein